MISMLATCLHLAGEKEVKIAELSTVGTIRLNMDASYYSYRDRINSHVLYLLSLCGIILIHHVTQLCLEVVNGL